MNRTVVRTPRSVNRGVRNSLSQSFNDLSCSQELNAITSSLASPSGNEKEKCASFPSITLPKISSVIEKDDFHCHLSSTLPRVETVAYTGTSIKQAQLNQKRPKSCTARVQSPTSSSSPQRTPEILRRNIRPRPSLPLAINSDHFHNPPSSPTLTTKSPNLAFYSKPLNLSKSAAVEETELVDQVRQRRSQDVRTTDGLCSTPPMSPALLRKFENSDKTVRKAKNLIDDYKRSNQHHRRQQEERKSLAEAMEEVKNCRYLRIVKTKDTCGTLKEKAGD